MIASFAHLTAPEVEALPRPLTLFLFPLGGIEQHGPHLPVGTKLLQAEEMTKAIAAELQARLPAWSFILMPLLPFSVDSYTNRFALNVRAHVVRDAVVDQCEELKRLKFHNFATVSSHLSPKQLCALEDAAKIVNRRSMMGGTRAQLASVMGVVVDSKDVVESPMIAIPKEHAGGNDTGQLLHWNESLVAKDYQSLSSKPRPKASVGRFFAWMKNELDGYWGNPAEALPENAMASFDNQVRTISDRMVPWLEQNKGQGIFKSGYHYFPMNGSFFKAYLLAMIFFVMMLIWVIWGVKDAFEK